MRKKIAKQIIEFAKTLPASAEVQMKRNVYGGDELIAKGVIEFPNGAKVDPKQVYTRLEPFAKPLNHERKLKRYYKIHGKNFIQAYKEWFIPYQSQLKMKFPKMFEKREVQKTAND